MGDLDDLWREAEAGWAFDCERPLVLASPPRTPPLPEPSRLQ